MLESLLLRSEGIAPRQDSLTAGVDLQGLVQRPDDQASLTRKPSKQNSCASCDVLDFVHSLATEIVSDVKQKLVAAKLLADPRGTG